MNEIKILVRTMNASKAGFEDVNKEIDKFAKESSESFSKTFNENLTRTFTTRINEAVTRTQNDIGQVGDRLGDTIGQRISTKITESISRTYRDANGRLRDERGRFASGAGSGGTDHVSVNVHDRNRDSEHVRVSVDVDKKSFTERLGELGTDAKDKISGFFSDGALSGLSSVFSGDVLSTVIKAGVIGSLGVALSSAISAAITSGVLVALGGGAIAAGIASAIKGSPTIQGAINELKEKAKGIFADFGGNFKGPLADFFDMASQMLDQLKPFIKDLGVSLGPVADQLAHGVIGFLQNALPGVLRAIKASEPLIKTLADELPGIGDAIGRFFDHLSKGAPEANVFFNDLLNLIPLVIRALGVLIEATTRVYVYIRYAFLTMVNIAATWAAGITGAAAMAFGWVPGLGPKLDRAARAAADFKNKVNRQLRGIDDNIDIKVRIRTFGLNTAVTLLDVTRQLKAIGAIGRAAGGAVGQAASGGPRSNMTWVGEHGPELVDLAPGSRVWTAGDSARMVAGGSGGGSVMAVARVDAGRAEERTLIDALVRVLRVEIFNTAGGDVQMGLGS